jgi:hypothetical protein
MYAPDLVDCRTCSQLWAGRTRRPSRRRACGRCWPARRAPSPRGCRTGWLRCRQTWTCPWSGVRQPYLQQEQATHLLCPAVTLQLAQSVLMLLLASLCRQPRRAPLEELQLRTPSDSGSAALAALGTLEFRQHARRLAGIFEGHKAARVPT